MKKLKCYVSNSVSLGVAGVLALGMSNDVSAKEPLKGASIGAILNGNIELRKEAGFAQYIPAETDLFFNLSKTEDMVHYLRKSQMGDVLVHLSKMEGNDVDEMLESAEFKEFTNVAGEEVFLALGDGSAKLVNDTGEMYSVYYQSYYSFFGKLILDLYQGEDLLATLGALENMAGDLMKPMMEKMLELEDYKMSPVYVGFKVSDAGERKKYLDLIQGALKNASALNDMIPDMNIPFEVDSSDKYGGFTGLKVDQNKLMEQMFKKPEMLKAAEMMGMDEDFMKQYNEVFKDFKISVLAGEVDDYIVIYLGDGAEGLKLAEDLNTSLLSSPEMAFLGEYKGKEVASITYVSEEIVSAFKGTTTFMEDFSVGINKVLSGTDFLGDTKHIQALLTKMANNGRKLANMAPASRFGSVGYIEDGFKIDSFHGEKSRSLDLDGKRKLAKIVMREDALFSASWVGNSESGALNVQQIEDLGNLIYQTAKMVAEHTRETENRDIQQFSEMFKMVDGQFSDDLLAVWQSAKAGMQQGMGNERAIVIDTKGKMPRVPGVPTDVLENAMIPRVAIGSDVVNRAKMAESWKGMDTNARKIKDKVEQLMNQKLNYMSPELAKKEGVDLWSYQLGVTSYEANLALGINDKMVFATTSPAFVESLVADYDEAGAEGGMEITFRADGVRALMQSVFDMQVLQTATADGAEENEVSEEEKIFADLMKASQELDSLDYSVRKVGGEVRSFFHLNKVN